MYDHRIQDMATALQDQGLIPAESYDQAVKVLWRCWEDAIADVWTVTDVIDCAKDNDIQLTEDEAREVLHITFEELDAEHGINWNVIFVHIDHFVKQGSSNGV